MRAGRIRGQGGIIARTVEGAGTIEESVSARDATGSREEEEERSQILFFGDLPISCQHLPLSEAIEKPADEGVWESWCEDADPGEGKGIG